MERKDKELEKTPKGYEVHWKVRKYAFYQYEEVEWKTTDKMESNLNGRIFDLEKKPQENSAEKEQLELTLRRSIDQLYDRIKELESDNKKLESALRDQRKFYEIHLPAREEPRYEEQCGSCTEVPFDRESVTRLDEKLLDTNREKKEVKSAPCGIKKKLLLGGAVALGVVVS
jgi:SMC interacting uncharacterized protein involved in chromosome segregation